MSWKYVMVANFKYHSTIYNSSVIVFYKINKYRKMYFVGSLRVFLQYYNCTKSHAYSRNKRIVNKLSAMSWLSHTKFSCARQHGHTSSPNSAEGIAVNQETHLYLLVNRCIVAKEPLSKQEGFLNESNGCIKVQFLGGNF